MALPAIALGIGKIVSGVIGATAKGLTVAAKATAKGATVAARAAGKAASATGRVVGKAARSTGRVIGKTARSTAKGLRRIINRTSKSTGKETLKSNAEKIRSNLTKAAKDLKKQRLNRDRIQRNVLERGEVRKMEKNIESTKTPTGKKVNSILKSPMSIFDKIFGFGGILLTGIIVNAIDGIVKKWEEFKKNNKPMFDFIGNIIKGVGDFLGGIEISSIDGGSAMDKFAVFDEEGELVGGKLVAIKKTVELFGGMVGKINSALGIQSNAEVKKETTQKLERFGFTAEKFEQKVKRKENNPWYQWWDFLDLFPNPVESIEILPKNNSSQSITPIKKNNSIGDQSSISSNSSNTQVVVVNRTNTKFVPFEVPSTSETDVASSGTSQDISPLW